MTHSNMLPTWLLPCLLLLSPVLCKTKSIKAKAPTTTRATSDPPQAASNVTLQDQELDLPSPSLLRSLYDIIVTVVEAPWSDSEAASRQGGGMGGMGAGMRFTVNTILATLATIFGVVGLGTVVLLAAKALAVGTLALFLAAVGALKNHHKDDSGGQTVHYVPIQHGHHHDFYHERSDLLPPYLDRNL